jgi:hypothetical protein
MADPTIDSHYKTRSNTIYCDVNFRCVLKQLPVYFIELCNIPHWWLFQWILNGGEYHSTIDLLFDWFGLACFANKNKNCQLSYSSFHTSQTGLQRCSDTSPFSIAWLFSRVSLSSRFASSVPSWSATPFSSGFPPSSSKKVVLVSFKSSLH